MPEGIDDAANSLNFWGSPQVSCAVGTVRIDEYVGVYGAFMSGSSYANERRNSSGTLARRPLPETVTNLSLKTCGARRC